MFGNQGDTLSRMFRDDAELRRLSKALAKAMNEGSDEAVGLAEIWEEIEARLRTIRSNHGASFPPDPPNSECRHAELEGVQFENGTLPSKGDYRYLLTWGHETLYLWTHTTNTNTGLIAEVDSSVKDSNIWRAFGSALRLAMGLASVLESIPEIKYRWIYRFDPGLDHDAQEYLDRSEFSFMGSSSIVRIRRVIELAGILELLHRSEPFFVAAQNVLVAAENHEFCQECALRPPEHRTHQDHEPDRWAQTIVLPKMEAAIVQATRAAEALLGKPGNRDSHQKLSRMKARWNGAVDLNPDDSFAAAGKSYFDYYYELFHLRAQSAHSFGSIPFELTRQLTIEAQSFAWEVLVAYFRKHSLSVGDAATALKLDLELVKSEPENWSTPLTAESKKEIGFPQDLG